MDSSTVSPSATTASNNSAIITQHPPTRCRSQKPVKKSHPRWSAADDASLSEIMSNKTSAPNWEQIVLKFPGKTQQQVADRWNKVLNPELVKGSWSPDEDAFIIKWVNEHGGRNWSTLASNLPGRLGKQCRERWVNSLDPDLLRKPWTEEEDQILIRYQKMWGNKWAKIAHFLPGRTDNSVKNRWNSSLKRKLERIAKGQNPVQKRGRKPKRPSTAPEVLNEEVPKPDFDSMELNVNPNNATENPNNDNASNSEDTNSSNILESTDRIKEGINNSLDTMNINTATPQNGFNQSPLMGLSPILSTESPLFSLLSPGVWNYKNGTPMSMKSPISFFLKSPGHANLNLQSPLPFSLDQVEPSQN